MSPATAALRAAAAWCVAACLATLAQAQSTEPPVPDPLPRQAGAAEAQPVVPLLDELPPDLLKAYLGARPKTLLVDPQGLLGAIDQRERAAFLDYHAGDSEIDLFAQVFKAGQRMPDEATMGDFMKRQFAEGRPAVVLQYVLGAPERSQIHLSPRLRGAVPPGERKRALESAMIQALEKIEPAAQFEAFLVQLSIRMYWMEKILAGQTAAVPAPTTSAAALGKLPKPARPSIRERIEPWIAPWIAPAKRIVGLAGVILVALGVWVAWQRLRLRRTGSRFPEVEVEPRLGGAHAAGVGAVISFASGTTSPATQRDQVPRYLHKG